MKKSLLLFTAIWTALLLAPPVYAADITLSASCTLADAILAANHDRAEGDCPAGRGADTIALTKDITLDGGLPKITSDITIEGNGYAISGAHRWRIFYNDGGALIIKDLTMTKGYVEGELIRNEDGTLKATTANSIGGAVYNEGELSIINSSFSGNSADGSGGAIYNRDGTARVSDSAFSGNSADEAGGAIYNWEGGELSIANSSFSDNSANWGGAIFNWVEGELSIGGSAFSGNSAYKAGGAIYNWYGELSISGNTFSDNSADEAGGAIVNGGDGTLGISDSTFSGNSAEYTGGVIVNWGELSIVSSTFSSNSAEYSGGVIDNWGELSITNNTFSDNSAGSWGGAIANRGELSIVNSIIAGRSGNACFSDGELKRNISNFILDGTCSPAFRGDPKLGELVEPEDGSPAYFPLLAGSPAIDAADDDHCPATDQIGTDRPQGAGCDIGAIEYAAP